MNKMVIRNNDPLSAKIRMGIFEKLHEKGLDITYATLSKEVHQFLTKKSKKSIYLIDEFEKYEIEGNPTDHLAKFEERYNIPSVKTILAGDFKHSQMDRKKAYTKMAKHFYFWEDYLQKNEVDFILGGTEGFFNMIPRAVSKRYGVQDVTLARPIPGRVCVTTDVYTENSLLEDYWKENKDKELTKAEKERATQFIESFRQKQDRSLVRSYTPGLSMQKIKFFLDRLKAELFIEKGRYPYMDLIGGTWRYILMLMRSRLAKMYYSEFDPQKKYVYYPLHQPHEAQITVVAPLYWNQVHTIEVISKFLPAGYQLYVKEHPNLIGGTPLGDLKSITKLPNVELLEPSVNSLDIINNVACVVTINSTIGWEAILLNKPVINLGTCFYEISGLTYSIRNLEKLPATIKKAINENPVDEDILKKFVNAIFATSFPGHLGFATTGEYYYRRGPEPEKVANDENIENIAKGIYNQLKQIENKSS